MSDIDDFVDIKTAANILKTSIKNVYAMCEKGKFPNARKLGWAIPKKDLKNPEILNRKAGRPWPSRIK